MSRLAQVAVVVCLLSTPLFAFQSEAKKQTATNWRAKRILLHREFGAELQELAMWCRSKGIEEQVTQTFKVYREYGLDRQYIFLPTEKSMPVAPIKGPKATWLEKLNEIKVAHAAKILELAKEAAEDGSYAVAFRLLHEVIHFDRDHQEVRRMLGHNKLNDGTWRIHSEKVKAPRVSSRPHDVVGWPAKSFFTINTPHFQIDSNASEKETALLAQWLESWHYVWRQVFFEYWAKGPIVKKWLAGNGSLKIPRRRFRVVFFKDHADYVKQVLPLQPGIERSAGYYNGDLKVSFFPATNIQGQRDDSTWRHELTHQMFRESIATRNMPFAQHFLWLDEGLAMYFESLKIDGQIATLGGFDSQRLQYSRWRLLRENYHVPIGELAAMDMQAFQRRTDLPFLYAESAGVAHMLMDSRQYNLQPVLVKFMRQIHVRNVKPNVFQAMIGRSYAELDKDYAEFLKVSSRDVEKRIENIGTISELAAMDGKLRDSAFDVIGSCINLRKLDVSKAKFTKERATGLQRLDLLEELYLNACVLEPGSLKRLGQLAALRELDLSNSSINDGQLDELLKIPGLKMLHVANTTVTDAGLLKIAKLPKLKMVDVTGAKVSTTGVANFRQKRSDVTVVQRNQN
ncbi:DUF1570 domain-containing protein [Mariniblastus fucicola]|nr:DUF1570 domain-containing protein [Mariniblastus fucicola]